MVPRTPAQPGDAGAKGAGVSTPLIRWLGSTDPVDETGVATFHAGGRSLDVPLPSFAAAHALAALIEHGQRAAAAQARRAAISYMRGAAQQLENDLA